jgi:hypothetical protein
MNQSQMIAGFIAGFTRGAIGDLKETITGFEVTDMSVSDDAVCTIIFNSASTEGGTIVITPGRDRE